MRTTLLRVAVAAALAAGLVGAGAPGRAAADGPTSPKDQAPAGDPAYAQGVEAVKRSDWPAAIRLFQAAVARDAGNADAYNWLAYSTRQNGDPRGALPLYEKALALDPKHRGAHEYIGETYLLLGDLAKAKEHLAILDKLCFFSCREYSDLKKAVEAYETSGGAVRPSSRYAP